MSLPETDDASRYANQLQKEKTVVLLNLPHTRGRPTPGRTAKSSSYARTPQKLDTRMQYLPFTPDARATGKFRACIKRILYAQTPPNERMHAAFAEPSTPTPIAPPVQHSALSPLCAAGHKNPPLPTFAAHRRAPVCTQNGPGALALEAASPFPQIKNPAMPSVAGMCSVPSAPIPREDKRAKSPAPFPACAGKGFPAPPGSILFRPAAPPPLHRAKGRWARC